jgi:hypothetical protein
MPDVTASRTLVKSAPELWTECSDADSLGRHLDRFGDIRITRLEPETAVAWEGELASGTVRLEPSGWGTRVVLTATPAPSPAGAEAAAVTPADVPEAGEVSLEPAEVAAALAPRDPEPEPDPVVAEPVVELDPDPEPVPEPDPEPEPVRQPGFFARLFGRVRGRPQAPPVLVDSDEEAEPEPEAVELAPEPVAVAPVAVASVAPVDSEPVAPDTKSPDPEAVLVAALDSLGQAHHRPYSRA